MTRHYAIHAKHNRSAAQFRYSAGLWAEFYAGATVADITPVRQRAFVAWMRQQGKSDGYIRRVVSDGKAAINGAWKRGELASAPYIDLSLAPEGKPRDRILSLAEMAALWNAIDAPHVRLYVLLALGTMARPQAITDLTTWAIDWSSGTINLLPHGQRQTKKRRPIIPIVETLKPVLRAIPPGPLVTWQGRKITTDVGTTFDKAVKRAGLGGTGVNLYTLRHTIISEVHKRCDRPHEVEIFAGHRSGSKTTERYIKFSPGYLAAAARAVDDYFADLEAMVGANLLDQFSTRAFELRASHPGILVEPRGIEPLTSTMPL